jgi:hypothetical protein
VDPKDDRTLRRQVIRAAQNEIRGFAALATLVIVTGGTLFLTTGWLGASDRVLWLTLSITVGLIAAWALRTWLLPRLP